MRVAAADLAAQHAALREPLAAALERVLASGMFIGGLEVEAFEREFADYCGVRHAVGMANGTDALALILRAAGVGPESSVAVPAFTFAATAEAVCHAGARPLLVDIDPASFTMDPQALERAVITAHPPVRAVIAVHLYGQAASMEAITRVAQRAGAVVIEDAAQAHGARFGERRVGGLGNAAAFSFYPTKNLGALGDAGAVTTDDGEIAARLRLLHDHGQTGKYEHGVLGWNSRLDALHAAVLRVKLRRLDEWNVRRRAIAAAYRAALADVPDVELPPAAAGCEHVYHLFVVRSGARDALRAHLAAAGISASVHYPLPLHLQAAFVSLGYRGGDFPAAEAAAREVLALPVYPELSDDAVEGVIAGVRAWAGVGTAARRVRAR
jgi:dTDP-4-amino-4,6-dideoxygalactose transaminase